MSLTCERCWHCGKGKHSRLEEQTLSNSEGAWRYIRDSGSMKGGRGGCTI
jgi:hypothetical protein